MRTLALALLTALVLYFPLVAYGETVDQLPRHTPGFPGSIYDEELLKEILDMLSRGQGSGAGEVPMDQFLPPPAGQAGSQGQVLPSLSDISIPSAELPSLPSISTPSLPALRAPSIGLPDPWLASLLVATVFAVALIAYFRGSIVGVLSSRLRGFSTPLRLKGLPRPEGADPIVLYWLGVEHVSRVTGLGKSATETHREYLLRAGGKLNVSKKNVFARLTESYELARFAHDSRSEVVEQARKSFEALVGGSES